jgi:DNA polymerase-3 subunit chi
MSSCIFHDTDAAQREAKLFGIVENAYRQRQKVLIFARTAARAEAIDRILWTHRQEAFIPHGILGAGEEADAAPVGIVTEEINPIGADVLVADGHCSLEFASGFGLIHEFVDRSSPEVHEACRERFRAYRGLQMAVEYERGK